VPAGPRVAAFYDWPPLLFLVKSRCELLIAAGNLDEARRLAEELRPGDDTQSLAARFIGAALCGKISTWRGEVATAIGQFELAAWCYDQYDWSDPGVRERIDTWLAEAYVSAGRLEDAHRIAARLARNYPGYAQGISGSKLAFQAYQQAWFFGATFVFTRQPEELVREDDRYRLRLSDGGTLTARTVVIAAGATYRRLGVPSLEDLHGRGVFYGAGVSEAPAMRGQKVFVVGGGNSAGQAAMHLAKWADQVTVLVRSQSLADSMYCSPSRSHATRTGSRGTPPPASST
jgi:glycine/D-amino acid oxidase-like deaminating enzyme